MKHTWGEINNAYKICLLTKRPQVKRLIVKYWLKEEDNIKTYFGEIGYEDTNWLEMA
jgi:hypothetical protein